MSNYSHTSQEPSLAYLTPDQPQQHQYGSAGKNPVQPTAYTMIDTTAISRMVNMMATVLYSKCIQHPAYRGDCPELDSVSVRLQEMLTSFMEHHATYSLCNLEFEYFLQDFLPTCAQYIKTQPDVLAYLGNQFAMAAQQLAQCLYPAVTYLTDSGFMIDTIESAIVIPDKKTLYTVTGSSDNDHWDNDVLSEGT